MLFVSSDEKLGSSSEGTFEDAVIVVVGCDDVQLLPGLNDMGNGANGLDSIVGGLFAEAELFPENPVKSLRTRSSSERIKGEMNRSISLLRTW